MKKFYVVIFALGSFVFSSFPQDLMGQDHSIARLWNEELLNAIRKDFARPPVHSRNLFHVSAVMYDAWAAYHPEADPYLLGRTRGGYECPFEGIVVPENIEEAQEMAISFAAYRLLTHRFQNSPGVFLTQMSFNQLMASKGYDINNTETDYINGGPAELGNYIASQYIAFGLQDGSNEAGNYVNQYYQPVNPSIHVEEPGNPDIIDPNRFQIITLTNAIDQSGNPVPSSPPFLSPEWGNVFPFSLQEEDKTDFSRDGNIYPVYHDPGPPALLDTTIASGLESFYKWCFLMVPIWQSHLDTTDGVMIDISPASKGNIQNYPTTEEEIRDFYNYFEGGDPGAGYDLNPITNQPYEPQMVKRGDYARVLAEFWADGPQSETPPGHWFTILHGVTDHPLFERKWMGEGEELSHLEYDVKSYLALGGAMHDVSITAWGIKGWYDYVRPVSAVRYLAGKGQSSDMDLPNYHPAGVPLIPGYIEIVEPGDELSGEENEHVGKIKLYTWRGPGYIEDPLVDMSGVGWILAENWWPYQRPTMVTPPFAGYISGHSTFSRTAAEVMTLLTGTPYFPGGMSNFVCAQNEFLHFEEGPSQNIVLQWATYQDASDQCSLSRIWGGIHPPIDDIPGRFIGMELGPDAFHFANDLFASEKPLVVDVSSSSEVINISGIGSTFTLEISFDREMNTSIMPELSFPGDNPFPEAIELVSASWTDSQTYTITCQVLSSEVEMDNIFISIQSAEDLDGRGQQVYLSGNPFRIDTKKPSITGVDLNQNLINDQLVGMGSLTVSINFDENCNTATNPDISFTGEDISGSVVLDLENSEWINASTFLAVYSLVDENIEAGGIGILVDGVTDAAGNSQITFQEDEILSLDTRNPILLSMEVSDEVLNQQDIGNAALTVVLEFDEEMNTTLVPQFLFSNGDPLQNSLVLNSGNSFWVDEFTYQRTYNLVNGQEEFFDLEISLLNMVDNAGNLPDQYEFSDLFVIDTKRPSVLNAQPSEVVLSDLHVGSSALQVTLEFGELMDQDQVPVVQLSGPGVENSLQFNFLNSSWLNETTFSAGFDLVDANAEITDISIQVDFARDLAGNFQQTFASGSGFTIDTKNPGLFLLTANTYNITIPGEGAFYLLSLFDEPMDENSMPSISFEPAGNVEDVLSFNEGQSQWLNNSMFQAIYNVADLDININDIDVEISGTTDLAGNPVVLISYEDYFSINMGSVSLNEIALDGVSVFPNPVFTGSNLTIRITDPMEDVEMRMVDNVGRIIVSKNLKGWTSGEHMLEIPTGIAEGMYFLQVTSGNISGNFKIMLVE